MISRPISAAEAEHKLKALLCAHPDYIGLSDQMLAFEAKIRYEAVQSCRWFCQEIKPLRDAMSPVERIKSFLACDPTMRTLSVYQWANLIKHKVNTFKDDDEFRRICSPKGTSRQQPDPTPEQIRERCLEIQAGWSPQEEQFRRAWASRAAGLQVHSSSIDNPSVSVFRQSDGRREKD